MELLLGTLPDEPDEFEVWPENLESLHVFTACATQWKVIGTRFSGLDYQALHSVMRMMWVKKMRQTFDDVRNMESAALEEMNRGA